MIGIRNPEVRDALRSCRAHFAFATAYGLIANILLLAFPLFLINVFQRVLTSRSFETLLVLFVGFVIAMLFRALFGWLRSALLIRAAIRIDRRLGARLVEALFERRAAGHTDIGSQALRDLDSFRFYTAGTGGNAIIDLPLGSLFLAVLFVMNVPMALTAVAAIVVITLLTIAEVFVTKSDITKSERESLNSYTFLDANLPSSEAIMSMGMAPGVLDKWQRTRERALSAQSETGYRGKAIEEAIAAARYIFLGVFIAVGVVQIIAGTVPVGGMIGAIFIFNFAMAPFVKLVQAWASFLPVKAGLARIERVLNEAPVLSERMELPRPTGELTAREASFFVAGSNRPILRNINLGLRPGTSLGIVGLIGSGKTTLARLLVGAMKPRTGSIALDGNEAWSWMRTGGGRFIGYVPQSVALLTATVAENIGRFGMFAEEEIIAAAKFAGAHDMIGDLPMGYDTVIGEGGHPISGGQKQLIALARAVIGRPSLVVLDEPNSNLDGPGEDALRGCIEQLRSAGSTVVLVSHRPNLVQGLDKILLLKDGEVVAFGDAPDVLQELGRPVVKRRVREPDGPQLIGEPADAD